MSERNSSRMAIVLSLIVSVLTGILSWNIVEPESFWEQSALYYYGALLLVLDIL